MTEEGPLHDRASDRPNLGEIAPGARTLASRAGVRGETDQLQEAFALLLVEAALLLVDAALVRGASRQLLAEHREAR